MMQGNFIRILGRSAPDLASVDVSGSCNLRCRMCSLEHNNPQPGMMSIDSLRKLSRQLLGIPIIELSSGCEPTLNKQLVEMLGILRDDHPGAFLNLTTNATLLTPKITQALITNRVDKLLISLDAAEPEVYEDIRRGARFDIVVENIRKLTTTFREHPASAPEIEIIFTFMELNKNQLKNMVDLVHSLGITSLIANGLVPFTEESENWKMWSINSVPPLTWLLAREAASYAKTRGVTLQFPDFAARPVHRCVDTNPVISWDGEVFPCFMCSFERTAYLEGQRIHFPRLVLGNFNKKPLREIWRSPKAVLFRLRLALGLLPEYCKTCAMQMGVLCPYQTLD